MSSTRRTLAVIGKNLEQSMGVRSNDISPALSPVPSPREIGRLPLRGVGRIEIGRVIPDPDQPRTEFSEDALERLAKSLGQKGQIQTIVVRWSEEHGKWIIVSGERRWRAACRAGLKTVDCSFREEDLDQSETLEEQLVENCLREDLKPIEEAKAFQKLMQLNRWTAKRLAEELCLPPARISRTMALLKLPDDIQQQVEAGEIPSRSAYELSKLTEDKARRKLARKASAGRLTQREAAAAVRQREGRPARHRGTRLTFHGEKSWRVTVSAQGKGTYHDVEQALQHALDEVRLRIDSNVQLF